MGEAKLAVNQPCARVRALGWMGTALVAAAAGPVVVPAPALAQIQEVMVTTRKREESLQDVPIAVSAITTEQIERQGISDLADVVQNQPSVQFDQAFGPSDNRVTIRGLSNTRGRSNVAFLVDGIDTTTENLISAGSGLLANRRLLTDVERIEIIKGPQSALYGRAAFAGAISYVTKEPGDVFEGRASIDVGDYGRRTIDAAFGGPITDTLGLRLTGVTFNEDGYYTNTMSGEDVGGVDGWGTALTAVWRPSDEMKVKARIEYSDESYDPRAVAHVYGDRAYALPESAKAIVRPIITGDPATQNLGSSATNLFNFGTYCPGRGFDPLNVQGEAAFCLPGIIGDADQYVIRHSENPRTGTDYPGTETKTFRASVIATMDLGHGLLTSYTGWTDFDGSDLYDQDYQASSALDYFGRGQRSYGTSDPAGGRRDTLLGHQEANQESSTHQFSQELRYETEINPALKLTGGVLFWQDERQLQDRNNITACAPFGRIGAEELVIDGQPVLSDQGVVFDAATGTLTRVAGLCDGTANTANSWQQFYRLVGTFDPARPNLPQGRLASPWDASTRHYSFYAVAEWSLTDALVLTLEDRMVREDFHLTKPGGSQCTEIAFPQGANPTSRWTLVNRVYCDNERITYGGIPPLPIEIGTITTGALTWRYIEGSTHSSYHTPKVTLDWSLTDDTKVYFSWAHAQKPGGINQLIGGGGSAPPGIQDERFEPEKLQAWELGLKTEFEWAGFWRVNTSGFFQDYTAKQVTIQVLSESLISQPRVVNASGAEVWGVELETVWQPAFLAGLQFNAGVTWLDATYTEWIDDTRNLVKVAVAGECPLVWKGPGAPDGTMDPDSPTARDPSSTVFCRLNNAGTDLERTPELAWVAGVSLQRPFLDTSFDYLLELSANYQDKRWADPENLVQLDSYTLFDLRAGLTSDTWEVLAYVDNLFDDDTARTAGSGPDFGQQVSELGFTAGFGTTHYFATLPDPRVFGVRATYRFGEGR